MGNYNVDGELTSFFLVLWRASFLFPSDCCADVVLLMFFCVSEAAFIFVGKSWEEWEFVNFDRYGECQWILMRQSMSRIWTFFGFVGWLPHKGLGGLSRLRLLFDYVTKYFRVWKKGVKDNPMFQCWNIYTMIAWGEFHNLLLNSNKAKDRNRNSGNMESICGASDEEIQNLCWWYAKAFLKSNQLWCSVYQLNDAIHFVYPSRYPWFSGASICCFHNISVVSLICSRICLLSCEL